jgi:hypothetical protein
VLHLKLFIRIYEVLLLLCLTIVFRYYVIFIDEFTRYSWIYFLKTKEELTNVFTLFKSQVENLLNTNIKILHSDGGTEYKPLTKRFSQIIHQITCSYTPQQNRISERKHHHVIELSLAIMQHASLPHKLWDEFFTSATYLINRSPPLQP